MWATAMIGGGGGGQLNYFWNFPEQEVLGRRILFLRTHIFLLLVVFRPISAELRLERRQCKTDTLGPNFRERASANIPHILTHL